MTSTAQVTIVAQLPVVLQQLILRIMIRDFVNADKMINMNQLAAISDNGDYAAISIHPFVYFFSKIDKAWVIETKDYVNEQVVKLSFAPQTNILVAVDIKNNTRLYGRVLYNSTGMFMWRPKLQNDNMFDGGDRASGTARSRKFQ